MSTEQTKQSTINGIVTFTEEQQALAKTVYNMVEYLYSSRFEEKLSIGELHHITNNIVKQYINDIKDIADNDTNDLLERYSYPFMDGGVLYFRLINNPAIPNGVYLQTGYSYRSWFSKDKIIVEYISPEDVKAKPPAMPIIR